MKRMKFKSFAALALLLPFLYACPKHTSNIAPEADTELQSSVDAVYATFLVSDVEMLAAIIGENNYFPDFYVPQPGEDPNKLYAYNQINNKYLVAAFNKVKCVDGRERSGSLYFTYDNPNPNAEKYHNFQFHGQISLVDYRVDGWLIRTVPGVVCHVYNQLSSPVFDPKKLKLSWTIEGSFEFIHPTDPAKNMSWSGKLTKTLVNTSDPAVYQANRLYPIDWSLAKVEYTGEGTGVVANEPFSFKINDFFPIQRDFTCFPSEIGGIVSTQPLRTWKKEFHPFKSGKMDCKIGSKYPRLIYLGNEGMPESAAQCDNSGMVLIKGNSYALNFNE